MKRTSAASVAIFAVIFVAPTFAQTQSNPAESNPAESNPAESNPDGRLAGLCEHSAATIGKLKTADVNDGLCMGAISGWRNVIDELPVLTPNRHSQIQIEASATNGQLIRTFVVYVKAHPEVENKDALLVFTWALRDAELLTEEARAETK